MPFYVITRQPSGEYLAMQGDRWINDIREAAVYTTKSGATSAIRRIWRGTCTIERIARLPDRVRRAGHPRHAHSTPPSGR
jgi:hypothetical protein